MLHQVQHGAPIAQAQQAVALPILKEQINFLHGEGLAPEGLIGLGQARRPGQGDPGVAGLVHPDGKNGLAEILAEFPPHIFIALAHIKGAGFGGKHIQHDLGGLHAVIQAAAGKQRYPLPLLARRAAMQIAQGVFLRQVQHRLGHIPRLEKNGHAQGPGLVHDHMHFAHPIGAGIIGAQAHIRPGDKGGHALGVHGAHLAAQLIFIQLVVQHPEIRAPAKGRGRLKGIHKRSPFSLSGAERGAFSDGVVFQRLL